jgi:hypothetical protein
MATREIYGAKGMKDITSRSTVTSNQLQDKGPGTLGSTAEGTESKEIGEGSKHFENVLGKLVKTQDEETLVAKYMKKAGGDAAKAARLYAEDTRVTPKAATSGNAPTQPKGAGARTAPAGGLPPGAPAGSTLGKKTNKGTEVILNGKVIGYAN